MSADPWGPEWVADELEDTYTETGDAPKWEVNDDFAADWALRKVAAAQAEIARIEHIAEREVERIRDWLRAARTDPEQTVVFFTERLIDYRRRLEAANPKLPSTYKLPNGRLVRRKGRPSFRVEDEAAFTVWALQNDPTLVSVKPRVSGLTDRYEPVFAAGHPDEGDEWIAPVVVTATGEQVPGVVRADGQVTYSVKAETVE